MKNCAFLTLEDRSDFCIYDHLLFEPLNALGWSVEEIPWTQKDINWHQYDSVVIRSTWDYQNAPEHFLATLETIEKETRLYNPLEICRWNLNKKYLNDLASKDVPIVPTFWLDCLNKDLIQSVFKRANAPCLVAKPLIGANADDTFILTLDEPASWETAIHIFSRRSVMVQPFIDSIQDEGEYSLFYFGGQFSHAIVKRPAKGDFRVQEEHGGLIRPVTPAEDLRQAGAKAIEAVGQTLLYARVDLVRLTTGQPVLMEMELIEPSLYFDQTPDAANFFAEQFKRMAD